MNSDPQPISVRLQLPHLLDEGLRRVLRDHTDEIVVLAHEDTNPADVLIVDPWLTQAPTDPDDDLPRLALTSQTPGGNPHLPYRHGAHRVLTLDAETDELIATVLAAHADHRRRRSIPFQIDHPLSGREEDVIVQVCAGLSNLEIADELSLGVNTVKTYIRSAYQKMGVNSRSQAVLWGNEHGFAPSSGTRTPGKQQLERSLDLSSAPSGTER